MGTSVGIAQRVLSKVCVSGEWIRVRGIHGAGAGVLCETHRKATRNCVLALSAAEAPTAVLDPEVGGLVGDAAKGHPGDAHAAASLLDQVQVAPTHEASAVERRIFA